MGKQALVTGANGITGSAILDHLLKDPANKDWEKVVATSFSAQHYKSDDSRLQYLALDFTKDVESLKAAMGSACAGVTHAYFSSYVDRPNFEELRPANEMLFQNFLSALVAVAPKLESVTLQTGGKGHLAPTVVPQVEEQARSDFDADNFYYPQEDYLKEQQKGQNWTWNVIRPEGITGFTPRPSGMNWALAFAVYFLICKELGIEAKAPTNQIYWNTADDASDARQIGALSVWASTTPRCANQAFNSTNGDYFVWRYMWPRLAGWFGAEARSDQTFEKGVPKEGEVQQEMSLAEWTKDKKPVWERLCDKAGVPEAKPTFDSVSWFIVDWCFRRTWMETNSMNKARKFGWTGHVDSYDSFVHAFESFRNAKQIP